MKYLNQIMKKLSLENPTLILMAGISASGKTIFTKELTKMITDSFVIDKDTINEAFLFEHIDSEGNFDYFHGNSRRARDSINQFYSKNVKFQSYQCMLDLAKDNLNHGKNPILDGNYAKEIRGDYLDRIVFPFFQDTDCKIRIVYCHAREEVIKKRTIERGLRRDDSKLVSEQSWRDFLQEQPIIPSELDSYNHIKIDTEKPSGINVSEVSKYLISL